MSLHARLLAGILVLVTGALVAAAVAIYAQQRSFLLGRLDQRVIAAAAPISFQLGVDARQLKRPLTEAKQDRIDASPLGKGLAGFLPNGSYGELIDINRRVLRGPVTTVDGEAQLSTPDFPASFPISAAGTAPKLFTVNSARGAGLRYRAAALALASGSEAILVALPLREVDETLHSLFIDEALAVVSAVIVLVGLGWIVIRISLRPLDQMGRVASAIADGDLSRRVSPVDARTEVGRLGLSLNKMLVRIERAFSDRARSEERRRQFLSDASHELRTPLASIRGYAELFRLGLVNDPGELERAMTRIEAEATRMGVLVEDLLALARLDERPEAEHVPVDLSELAGRAADDARVRASDRTVILDAPAPVQVVGDPGALNQVLANLTTNAMIHTPEGSPIELSVRHEGPEAVIEIRDHGAGVPKGAEQHVFERFWRAEGGRARGRGGSGLGLSIVAEIAEAHGGSASAANHPDGGAVFTVRLPASPVAEPASERAGDSAAEPARR